MSKLIEMVINIFIKWLIVTVLLAATNSLNLIIPAFTFLAIDEWIYQKRKFS